MSCINNFNFLLLSLAILSTISTSTIYPYINSPRVVSPQTSVPTVVLPPVAYSQSPIVYPIVTRRQTEFPIDISQEEEPTCDELKKMWRKMRRIARQMEITNEIPRLQDPFVSSAYNYKSKYPNPNPYSHAKSSNIKVFQANKNKNMEIFNEYQKVAQPSRNFGAIISDPVEHKFYKVQNKLSGSPNSIGRPKSSMHLGFDDFDDDYSAKSGIRRNPGRSMGRFSNSPAPEEVIGVYGTIMATPEERDRYRSRSRNREPGFRARFGGLNRGPSGRVPFRATERHNSQHYGTVVTHMPADRSDISVNTRYAGPPVYRNSPAVEYGEFPTEIGQRLSNAATRVERIDKIPNAEKLRNSCQRVRNKPCKNDVDCFCIDSPKLFCGGNQCRPIYKAQKYNRTNWGKSFLVENPYDYNFVEYGYKQDPLWPAPY